MFKWLSNLEWNFGFLEAGNTFTESLMDFYNLICVYLILISFLICYWLIFILINNKFKKNCLLNVFNKNFFFKKNSFIKYFINITLKDRNYSYINLYDIKDAPQLESRWCSVPLSFVSLVAYPSMGLEYGISPDITPLVILKIIANQWFWIVDIETTVSPGLLEECGENNNLLFYESDLFKLFLDTYGDKNAFTKGLEDLKYTTLHKRVEVNLVNENPSFYRLLAIDNKIILPTNTPIKLIITSIDVLHSFAIPAFSVKIDAIPGRLSEQVIIINKPGLYWGQCSELCGPYHGFMPIVIEVTSYPIFLQSFYKINLNV